jgi:Tfp pilus assembly protein PilO
MRNLPWYGYILIAFLIFILFYFLYYKPKNEELNSLRRERISVEREVQKAKVQKRQVEKLKAELKELNIKLEELEQIIPEKKEIDAILRRIQQLASDSRLTIIKFAPKGEIEQEYYLEWPISMKLNGNYHNLGIFFDHLSRFSRLFNVENITISALRNQTSTNTITVDCIAKTYIFKEKIPQSTEQNKESKRKKKRG